MGYDTTVMNRSVFLRHYDQEMAEKVVDYMEKHGTKFLRESQPICIEKVQSSPHELKVYWKDKSGLEHSVSMFFSKLIQSAGEL